MPLCQYGKFNNFEKGYLGELYYVSDFYETQCSGCILRLEYQVLQVVI